MKYLKKIFLSLIVIISIQSCASLPSKSIPKSYTPSKDIGMAVGAISFTNKKPIRNGYYFNFKKKDDPSMKFQITIKPEQMIAMKFKPDFFEDGNAVYYFSTSAEPGIYVLEDLALFENGGLYRYTEKINGDISIKIEESKITYCGEIHYDTRQEKLTFSDRWERDSKNMNQLFPNLKIESTSN